MIDSYLSSTHEEAMLALLFWTNPHQLSSWPFSKFPGWRLTSSNAILLLVRNQAEIIIVKRIILGRIYMNWVGNEPRSCNQGRH